MKLKISDLPLQFEDIANEIGIDNAKILFREFFGNIKDLASKYNMSESYIISIINRHKKVG